MSSTRKPVLICFSLVITLTVSAQFRIRLTDTYTNKTFELKKGSGVNFLFRLNDSTQFYRISTIDVLEENRISFRKIGYIPLEKIGSLTGSRIGNMVFCFAAFGALGLGTSLRVNHKNNLPVDIILLATSNIAAIQLHLAWNRWYLKRHAIGKRMRMEVISDN